jgi:hypothetical protein
MIRNPLIPRLRVPRRTLGCVTLIAALAMFAGCSIFEPETKAPPAPVEPPKPAALPPLATHTFPFDPKTTTVVGALQVTHSRH